MIFEKPLTFDECELLVKNTLITTNYYNIHHYLSYALYILIVVLVITIAWRYIRVHLKK